MGNGLQRLYPTLQVVGFATYFTSRAKRYTAEAN